MRELPIDARLSDLVFQLSRHGSAVVVAPPGSGKTTRVPPAILRAGMLLPDHPRVLLLQPRRVAARAAAARIAAENGWTLGEEVGYQVRFERRESSRTRLLVATEGILTRRLLADPFLEGFGAVVLDEFHERSLHTDLALALLREVRETVREDLKLVVMSATLDAEPVAEYLGGCPMIQVESRPYPIELEYRPGSSAPLHERVAGAVAELLEAAADRDPGDVLVFLPGWSEIRRAAQALEPLAQRYGLLVLPLHGGLPAEEQDRALRPAEERKIVLATNVAETSLTIDGVETVIDSGLVRQARHDLDRGLDRLLLERISRASAAQRAGRAGRTSPGRCVRLWSPREERGMPPFELPEVRRLDLAATCLALHTWGHLDPAKSRWYEAPPPAALEAAERLLAMLGAIEQERGPITPLGRQLLALPVHPRLGRLLIDSARVGLLREGATLAALLSERDLCRASAHASGSETSSPRALACQSDLLVRMDLLSEAEQARFAPSLRTRGIDPASARQVARARDELIRIGRRLLAAGETASLPGRDEDDLLLRLVLSAYPDRVARRRGADRSTGVMVGGRGVRLAPESVVHEAELFIALDPHEERRGGALQARVRLASAIQVEWLEQLFPTSIRRERSVSFDEGRQRASALQRTWYRGLLLREDSVPALPHEASAVLADALCARAEEFFGNDPGAASWLSRVAFLKQAMPEEGWPELGGTALGELLASICSGKQSVDEVRRIPLVPLLRGVLTSRQARLLDQEAPETLTVPSGSRIRLTYPSTGPPVLAVRLQELFGWTDTPRLAAGRVGVLLHLLGPNFRPVQITDDLRSFWSNAYFQVRKDLRARYPRHAWPEDPPSAAPEAKGGRRRS